VKLFGHPMHPMLVHFPIALWSVGTMADSLTIFHIGDIGSIGGLAIAGGLLLAIPAMLMGLIDYLELEEPVLPTANTHMMLMGSAWCVYLLALYERMDGLAMTGILTPLGFGASVAGFLLLGAGGWYGGQLVYRHGAGVRREA
jgi:uncharacterized membrane protein